MSRGTTMDSTESTTGTTSTVTVERVTDHLGRGSGLATARLAPRPAALGGRRDARRRRRRADRPCVAPATRSRSTGCSRPRRSPSPTAQLYLEQFPTSPLILSPFTDELPIPKALAPTPVSEFSTWKGGAARTRRRPAELARQPAAPDVVRARSARPTRWSTRSSCWCASTRSPPRRSCRSTRSASRRPRSTPPASRSPPESQRDPAAEHHLRLQRDLPRTAHQRGVRQAGPRPVHQPARREPARTSTARTSARPTRRS